MRNLTNNELSNISGAGDLYLTSKISTDGISNTCVNGIMKTLQDNLKDPLSDRDFIISIITSCSLTELEALDDRMDSTLPFKAELF